MISISKQENPESLNLDVNEDELKQIIYILPIDPRTNRIMLTSKKDKEKEKWGLPKGEVDSHENQEADVIREVYEQVGVRGQIVGLVGSFYESGKKGKPKSHIKVYELQIDELFKKWPQKKERDRRWFSYQEISEILDNKPYLIQALQQTCFANTTVIERAPKIITPPADVKEKKTAKIIKKLFNKSEKKE